MKELKGVLANKNTQFLIGIDHTKFLLNEARKADKANKAELTALFYATYFEHQINHLIYLTGQRKKLSDSCIKNILRKASLEDKCTWILEVLGMKQINRDHLEKINSIAEVRNRFVHYKWPSLDDEQLNKEEAMLKATLVNVQKTVNCIRKFEEKHLFKGTRKKTLRKLGKDMRE